jgi:hypothetical protein
MQERKNKQLFLSLALLVSTTVLTWFLFSAKEDDIVDKTIFKVQDLTSIDHIILETASEKVDLSFVNSQWLVNEGYPADQRMIEVLFATLQQAEPKRKAASALSDSIATEIGKKGVSVSLFSGNEKQLTFSAGGNSSKTQAFFKNEAGDVFVMVIPGYRVYVTGILEMNSSDFRDKYVFGFNWRNFKSLKSEFPKAPNQNFQVSMQKNFFSIEGMAKVDTSKLNSFLDDISLLTVDQYVKSNQEIDSLSTGHPMMVITITDVANRTYDLKLFEAHGERTPGLIGNQQVLFESPKIRQIVRPRSFFAPR